MDGVERLSPPCLSNLCLTPSPSGQREGGCPRSWRLAVFDLAGGANTVSWHRHQNQLTAADLPLMLFISSIRLHEMKEKHQRNGGKRGPLRRSLLNVASGKASIVGGAFWRGRGVETKMTFVPSCCLLLFKALVCGSDLPTITSLGNGKKREKKKANGNFPVRINHPVSPF